MCRGTGQGKRMWEMLEADLTGDPDIDSTSRNGGWLGHASAALMSEERTVQLTLTAISPVGQLPRTALIN